MSKNKKQSGNNLQERNDTKSNDPIQKKNIFQLIQPINKIRQSTNIDQQNPLAFAENLILFLKTYHPEELNKLQFSENDSVDDLLLFLIKTVIDLNYKIVFNDNNLEDLNLRILYDINPTEWKWYVFDTVIIDKISSEELKIGYAYFLKALGPYCFHDATKSDYTNTDDIEYEMEFDMMGSDERAYNEQGEYDEGMAQEADEETNKELYRLRILKEKFNQYSFEPYNKFTEYIPKNDFEKEFKLFLVKLIELDYSVIHKFYPSENVYEDGGVDFSDTFLIYLDSEIEIGVEEEHFRYMNENANNGNSDPMGWYSIENGIIKKETSEQNVKDMFHVLHCLEEIYHKFLNKL